MQQQYEQLTAGILLGGASQRMGTPKYQLIHPQGLTFLHFKIQQLLPKISQILLAGAPSFSEKIPFEGVSLLWDQNPYQGPLEGLCTLLSGLQTSFLFLTACDMPSLQLPFLELLYAKASTSQKMVVPLDFKGNAVFLCSLIPKSYISTILECRLHAKALKALVPLVEILWLTPEEWKEVDPQGLSLKNINTPEEYHDFLNHYQAESTS